MKTPAAFIAVLFTASLLSAQTQPTAKTTDTTAPAVTPAAAKTAPATTVTPAKPAEKKPAPEPKIPGLTIPRANGGLEAVDNDLKLSFYDKKKKPMAPDVTRATARWPNQRGRGDIHAVLNLSGNALMSGNNRAIGPYTYDIYISLFLGDGDDAKLVESFKVSFRG